MTKDITPFIKKATEDVTMTEAERAYMWSTISQYKSMKPLTRPRVPAGAGFPLLIAFARPMSFALVLMVVFTGSLSYAAESALPGNPLYAVKTNLNEPLKLALATNAEAKAEAHMQLAERRIAEASALAAEGTLDAGTETKLALAFESHAQSASRIVESVEQDDASSAVDLTSKFESRLAARESVLTRVRGTRDESVLSGAIRSAGFAVASIRTRNEQKVAVSAETPEIVPMALALPAEIGGGPEFDEPMARKAAPAPAASSEGALDKTDETAARRMQDSARRQLRDAQKALKNDAGRLTEDTRAQAREELTLAEDFISEGREHLKDGSVALAFHAFQQSLIISEKIAVMVDSATTLAKARSRAPREDDRDSRRDAAAASDVHTLSFPAPETAISITQEADATATMLFDPTATFETPAPVSIPPSKQIFAPDVDVLEGVIRGASTSRDANPGKGSKDIDL